MSVSATIEDVDKVQTVLGSACARNASVELLSQQAGGEETCARVRMLAYVDGELVVDRPTTSASDDSFAAGKRLSATLTLGQERWSFKTRVIKPVKLVRLNATKRVMGMTMDVPQSLERSQRRNNFRVSVASLGIGCRVQWESKKHRHACDLDARFAEGMISNVSGRGLAVVLPKSCARRLKDGVHIFVQFHLPNMDEDLLVMAEVRFSRPIQRQDTVLVGLTLFALPTDEQQKLEQHLSEFVVWQERQSLKRRR